MLETVSCPVRAASTLPKVTVIKTGKDTKVLCFFFTLLFIFFFIRLLKLQMRKINIGRLSFVSHDQITS